MANVRKMPKRYLDGAPADVADIFDHPNYADRYTVFLREIHKGPRVDAIFYRAMSENPFHPQGIGLSGELSPRELSQYRDANRRRRIAWADLPEKVQQCVRQDCGEQL